MNKPQCQQNGCTSAADYEYSLPGDGGKFICEPHAQRVRDVAETMGYALELKPLAQNGASGGAKAGPAAPVVNGIGSQLFSPASFLSSLLSKVLSAQPVASPTMEPLPPGKPKTEAEIREAISQIEFRLEEACSCRAKGKGLECAHQYEVNKMLIRALRWVLGEEQIFGVACRARAESIGWQPTAAGTMVGQSRIVTTTEPVPPPPTI